MSRLKKLVSQILPMYRHMYAERNDEDNCISLITLFCVETKSSFVIHSLYLGPPTFVGHTKEMCVEALAKGQIIANYKVSKDIFK